MHAFSCLAKSERKKKKSGASESHAKIAEKLLAAQMRREALKHVEGYIMLVLLCSASAHCLSDLMDVVTRAKYQMDL